MKKLGPTLCRLTLRFVFTQDKIVFTHGFIETILSTAHLFSHLPEIVLK